MSNLLTTSARSLVTCSNRIWRIASVSKTPFCIPIQSPHFVVRLRLALAVLSSGTLVPIQFFCNSQRSSRMMPSLAPSTICTRAGTYHRQFIPLVLLSSPSLHPAGSLRPVCWVDCHLSECREGVDLPPHLNDGETYFKNSRKIFSEVNCQPKWLVHDNP